ncbi:hypothetical protein JRI60_02270 [Archangium violaceum]|uniref:hypothetical protein n=1 Tax=Archangium violaceum TaxID=83451 RepID=UPI0019501473|nr:hypothetical protein [Archangium violaceum]QRN97927.1 hypothetical protein JRI60_02270 [Archangium violaceum]
MARRPGPPSLLCAALLLGACRPRPAEPPPPAAVAAPAPTPAPAASGAPVRITGLSLSLLEPVPPEHCRWVRLGLEGARAELFTFEGACERAQLSWSHDGGKGAVLLASHVEAPERAWVVDFASGQGVELALPWLGHTTDLGFDPEGHPVALVSPEGLPTTAEGRPVARAFLHEGDGWRLLETLELASFGPSTSRDDPEALRATVTVERGSDDLAALGNAFPHKRSGGDGEWVLARTPGGPLFSWRARAGQPDSCMPLSWYEGSRITEPERLALPAEACFQLYLREDVLLVSSEEAARLYDVKRHKWLASADKALAARFWPPVLVTAASPLP